MTPAKTDRQIAEIKLKRLARTHRTAERKLAQAIADRDQAILQAFAAGFTQTQVARITGLTRGRVAQIALAGKDGKP